jgi:hypothetical protein
MSNRASLLADSQFCTEVATFEHTTSWTIKQFLLLIKSAKTKDMLESPAFDIPVFRSDGQPVFTTWNLRCYPAGNEEASKNHVSLYLHLASLCHMGDKSIRAKFEIGLEPTSLDEDSVNEFSPNSSRGIPKWMSHVSLTANPDDYLTDGNLVIQCRITLGPLSYAGGPQVDNPNRMKLAASNLTAAERQQWESLKETTFVDLERGSVTLVFGGEGEEEEERCHTFPLAARSSIFRTMLTVDMLEKASGKILLPDISPATGRELLFYLYTGHVRSAVSEQVRYRTVRY